MILFQIWLGLSVVRLLYYIVRGILNVMHLKKIEKEMGHVDGDYEGMLAMHNSKGIFTSIVSCIISGLLLLFTS